MADSFETFRWEQLAKRQKVYIVAGALLVVIVICGFAFDSYRSWQSIQKFEREKIEAERQAREALKTAADLAKEKVEQEKKLAETEAKRDGKVNEVEAAKIKVNDDRLELNRARRERRGDNPSPEQLCSELAALGYPCR